MSELGDIYKAMRDSGDQDIRPSRAEETETRLAYDEGKLKTAGIRYAVKCRENGHIQAWDEKGDLHQFWARTGKILGSYERGISNFIRQIKEVKP